MSHFTTIFLDLKDASLASDLRNALDDDWRSAFSFVYPTSSPSIPVSPDIAVIDNKTSLRDLNDSAMVIFAGNQENNTDQIFSFCNPELEKLHEEVLRAFDYLEVSSLNKESQLIDIKYRQMVEELLKPLSTRIRVMSKQLEMRDSLLEQLPIGLIGIDDSNLVVMVNSCARRILEGDNMPVYGASVETLYDGKIASFMEENQQELIINETLSIRKAPFNFKSDFAGHILVLWNQIN